MNYNYPTADKNLLDRDESQNFYPPNTTDLGESKFPDVSKSEY